MERLRIKDLPEEDRPYEKLEKSGAESLTDAELLAIIIRTGTKNSTSLDLTRRIMNEFSNGQGLRYLRDTSISQLRRINGVGRVKAIQLKAAGELATRMSGSTSMKRKKITSPCDVRDIYLDRLRYVNKEKFIVLALNTRNEIIREIEVSVGSLSETIVHPREVFGEVVKEPAAAVILMHNHPSGDPTPSENDKKTTTRLEEAGKILGIRILDHVIIGNRNIFSFKENGLM